MANDIDEAYLARLTAFEFPDMPAEPAAAPTAGAGRGSYAGYDAAQDAASKAPQDSMTAYDPTIREQLATLLQRGFEGMGVDRYRARANAQTILGGESSNLPVSIGIADFVPFLGTAFQTQEAARMGEEALQSVEQGNYGTAALQGAGAVVGLVPGAAGTLKTGKQLLSETGQQLDRAIMEGTGPLAAVVPDALKPMYAVQPGKFSPQQEVAQAVEVVKADPALSVYSSQAERAPSVALRLARPEIVGTGSKGALTVGDVGVVLEKSQLAMNNGKPLDPANPKDLVKMVDSASAEAEYQLSQPVSGATWYEDDVTDAFTLGAKIVPELATDEPLRVLTTAFAASTSYNKRAGENWSVAMRIAEGLMKDGKVYSRNPENGKLWGGTTGPIMEQQLKLHEYMIKRMGLEGYAEWLLTPHPVKEIAQMKADSGLYKTANIPGKATDMKMGSFLLGEKGGAFFLNLNGIKETTADKWFTRTYNRHTGTLTSGPVSEQGLVDAPRNESERSLMKSWNRAVASNVKLDEQANQAVLWYYEQSLYFNLGIKSARSESFSDGAKNLLNSRGIEFTDAEIVGARSSRNEVKAAAKQAGPAAAGDSIGVGQIAPADGSPTPAAAVTKPKRAPKSKAQ